MHPYRPLHCRISRSAAPRRLSTLLPLLLFTLSVPAALPALEYGLNCGAPIIAATGQISGSTDPDVMKATGAQWVRVNFILGPWTTPDDATPRGPESLTWFQTYDRIIDGYVSRGVQVYGLIGAESVRNATRDRLNTEDFTADLTAAALKIIGHYRDRVTVYEIFNEPNDWAGGTSSQVEPTWMARYMESVYQAVKIDNGHSADPSWQSVKLITGPVFTHDLDTGGPYLSQVFTAGTTQLHWESIKQQTGTYPFDGVGFHVYVKQGFEPNNEVAQYIKRNLDAVWSALVALEGADTQKRIYVSEFGWNSYYTNEATQASKMDVAFNVFESDPRVAQADWFTLTDWGDNDWGVYRQEPYTEVNRKEAYAVFVAHAASAPPRNDAAFQSGSVPLWFEPGEAKALSVTVRNTGTTTWQAGSGADRTWSLAAGDEAAGAPADNAFLWSDFGVGGTSLSPTDQHTWLSGDVTPGGSETFQFTATAPSTFPRGPKPFTAVLWNKDAGFVGTPLSIEPLVVYRSESLANNGDFETANLGGWTTFGDFDGVQSGAWFAGITPSHGTHFVGAAANFGQKNGGAYQRFSSVPGGRYGAVVEVRTYREGGSPGDTACRIGIDPAGGVDPNGTGIEWSSWTESQGAWTRVAARATASDDRVTVFLQAYQNAPTWNITAFDDVIVGGPDGDNRRAGFMVY